MDDNEIEVGDVVTVYGWGGAEVIDGAREAVCEYLSVGTVTVAVVGEDWIEDEDGRRFDMGMVVKG